METIWTGLNCPVLGLWWVLFCFWQEHGSGRALCFTECWDPQESGKVLWGRHAPHQDDQWGMKGLGNGGCGWAFAFIWLSSCRTQTCAVPCCWSRPPTVSSTCAAPWCGSLPSTWSLPVTASAKQARYPAEPLRVRCNTHIYSGKGSPNPFESFTLTMNTAIWPNQDSSFDFSIMY